MVSRVGEDGDVLNSTIFHQAAPFSLFIEVSTVGTPVWCSGTGYMIAGIGQCIYFTVVSEGAQRYRWHRPYRSLDVNGGNEATLNVVANLIVGGDEDIGTFAVGKRCIAAGFCQYD